MQAITGFLREVGNCKRHLKHVYYTARDADTKSDSKQLVAGLIRMQDQLERMIELARSSRTARRLIDDRTLTATLSRWTIGLPQRVKDYREKYKSSTQSHLHRYFESLAEYVQSISHELDRWIVDLETAVSLPRPPRE